MRRVALMIRPRLIPSPPPDRLPMSYALILQHDPAFGPGRVVPVFRDYGIPTKLLRLDEGAGVPQDLDGVRVLVLLGGTQRLVEDAASDFNASGDAPTGFLDDEVALVKRMVDADRPTLGFGLGAQLLAKAAGAKVSPNVKPGAAEGQTGEPLPHLGWGPITLPFPGGTDPVAFGMGDGTPMFFWQRDAFELPRLPPPAGFDPEKKGPPPPSGNALICSTAWCKNAGFRFKDNLYGFAFHPELEREDIDRVLKLQGGMVGAAHGTGARGRVEEETEKHFPRYRRLGDKLLANFVQFSHAYEEFGR